MKSHVIGWIVVALGMAPLAEAGVFETSLGYSYSKSTYNGGSFNSSHSWNGAIGYFFTQDSQVQFSYQDTRTAEFVPNVQDLLYRDRVYSLNLMYHLMSEGAPVRPFLRFGVGQLNRDATGSYQGGFSPPGRLDQVTVIGGVGMRVKLSSRFGLKIDGTSYLSGGRVSTWKDNFNLSLGGSFYF
jgi:hypothetical protein